MSNFRKTVFVTTIFIFTFILLSVLIIEPWWYTEEAYYKDANLRKKLAGSIDFLITGASFATYGFDTRIIDKELNCNSYNLSAESMTINGKYVMLKKEIQRNPIETVVLEISYESLNRVYEDFSFGDFRTISRLDSHMERAEFLINYVHFDDWLHIYSRLIRNGIQNWGNLILGKPVAKLDPSMKGFKPMRSNDVRLSNEEATKYNSLALYRPGDKNEIETLKEIFSLCESSQSRVIVTVVPNSNALMFEGNNLDEFHVWVQSLCDAQHCELYDFNLLKDRYNLFKDEVSFNDIEHLSEVGAEAFTKSFCEILQAVDRGEDVHDRFYASYAEMKFDSPYMKYLEY